MAATLGTVTTQGKVPLEPSFLEKVTVTMDGSYPTGGEVLGLATKFPGKTILAVQALGLASNGDLPVPDLTNDKLKMFVLSTGVEVANAVDLTGVTAEILVISR